jgi:hypothetical protein
MVVLKRTGLATTLPMFTHERRGRRNQHWAGVVGSVAAGVGDGPDVRQSLFWRQGMLMLPLAQNPCSRTAGIPLEERSTSARPEFAPSARNFGHVVAASWVAPL